MEKIDLTNYEAYFLDYMEGSLSLEEQRDLISFLDQHPELKDELELDLTAVSLLPDAIQFDNKAALRIDESELILTPNTLPDLMIACLEKQLSPRHEAQLLTYIANEGLEKTYLTYTNTILQPDLTVVFEEKSKLKVKTGMVISMSFVKRAAAIAAVGLVLVTLAINWNGAPGIVNPNTESKFATDVNQIKFLRNRFERQIDSIENTNDDLVEEEMNRFPNQTPRNFPPKDLEDAFDNFENNGIVAVQKDSLNPSQKQRDLNDKTDPFKTDEIVKIDRNVPAIGEPDLVVPMDEVAGVRTEEPYRIVTDAASNLVNKEIEFTRDRDLSNNNYVAYSFKIGNFGFEHKKATK